MIRKIILLITIIYLHSPVWAEQLHDTLPNSNENSEVKKVEKEIVKIHFRFDKASLDREYLNNSLALDLIDKMFSDETIYAHLDSVSISATSSPEGVYDYNANLAHRRAWSVKNYLKKHYPGLRKVNINVYSGVYEWSKVIPYIEQDNNIPYKKRILAILKNPDNLSRATIEWRLKNIANGAAWRHVVNHLYHLRQGDTGINIYLRPFIIPLKDTKTDTIQPVIKAPIIPLIVNNDSLKLNNIINPKLKTTKADKPLFALKTNLLFDALSLVNLELEVPIGKRFSVAGEVIFPWWSIDNGKANSKRHRIQVLNVNIEGKCWLGNRDKRPAMTGWYTGLYIGSGIYDLEYSAKGYQGEASIIGGISGGYAHTINKRGNLRLEYSLGVGYMQTNYRYYEVHYSFMEEWHPMHNLEGKYSFIGPTRAKVSLVWMLNKRGARK